MSPSNPESFGRTIQLFLVDGVPNGLIIASIHGWTGTVHVATQSTFGRLRARPEVDRTGIYILFGPDPQDALSKRAYIGEADSVAKRINQSAEERGFWEIAVAVTTSDEALTKGHVRYLEARLIEMTKDAGRVVPDNTQSPPSERRHLPEADRANMEAFLANLKVILPVIGLDLLKPNPRVSVTKATAATAASTIPIDDTQPPAVSPFFFVRHKSGISARAVEQDGEFVVLKGSEARKDSGAVGQSYQELKQELIAKGILTALPGREAWQFACDYVFRSPSAAAAVVLDRNANGRTEWRTEGTNLTYHQWQEQRSRLPRLDL